MSCFKKVFLSFLCIVFVLASEGRGLDIKNSLTRTSETDNYPDCPIDSAPITLVEIPVPAYAMTAGSTSPFFCILDITYIADLHDPVSDALLLSGQCKSKILFFCVDGILHSALQLRTVTSFDVLAEKFIDAPLIRFIEPLYDDVAEVLVVQAQNSSGIDVFNGKQFTASGTLKNQVAYITYEDNGPHIPPGPVPEGDYHYSGNIILSSQIDVSADRKLYFDDDTNLSGNYHAISLTPAPYPIIYIATGGAVTLEEIVLQDFSPLHIATDPSTSIVFGNRTTIELAKDETLTGTWSFEGACVLRGNGQTLTLGSLGKINVDKSGSSLLFENITIAGLSDKNLRCLNNSCSFLFKDTKLVLSDDFVVDTGFFNVLDQLKIVGAKTLTYATDQQSTIASNASVYLAKNGTFNYAPPVADSTLINMTDETSTLWLDNATLSVTTTGFRLIDGTLMVANKSFLENTGATSLSESIAIKNIDILAGGSLDVKSGILSLI